jgi:hypothetical protein
MKGCAMRFSLIVFLATSVAAAEDDLSFNRDIRPILSDKCFFCHGPDPEERKADLRLDIEAVAKELAIVPGNPDESEFILRITDLDDLMPPEKSGKSLTPDEIALLETWIRQGAPYEAYWAYEPPKKHPTPTVQNQGWSGNWIDRFILARLEAEELEPSAGADKITLARRLYFDLIGLPPTPEQAAAFDSSSYESVVDELLASERFGERMAIYWLDLVRYASTVGYHGDQDHAASAYREYVIDAFNRNVSFDQFTREQLAGDLLPESTVEQKVASGYNRIHQTSHEGGVQEKEYLTIYAADRVRNVSAVWMGATVGCAQCHDHKFDPYTAKDFYALAAVFADLDENSHLNSARRKGLNFNAVPTARPPEIDLPSGQRAMISLSVEPREIRILPRGNWLDDSGEVVEAAVPEFLGAIDSGDARASRLDFANWLCDQEKGTGGLTARVFVNRIWYLFFGVGLSASLDDFGGQGEPPVHPELLDRLAVDFYENGWDIKRLVKSLVMTNSYRQSSLDSPSLRETDPLNRLYARQSRFRLPAEVIRDNALSISGLLRLERDGLTIKPYQPPGYYRHLNFPTRTYKHDVDSKQWRRGVYMHWQRQFLHPMLKAFDAPSREECTAQRPQSNTPLAALTLLNDPTFVEASRFFAERVLREGGESEDSRLDFTWQLAVSRSPDAEERKLSQHLLAQARHEGSVPKAGIKPVDSTIPPDELAAWTALTRALLNLNETITRN